MTTIFFQGTYPFRYFLVDLFGDVSEVSAKEFNEIVGFNRNIVPMRYDPNNINRQNFFLDGILIGYRERFANS